jgi:hypothetical protein
MLQELSHVVNIWFQFKLHSYYISILINIINLVICNYMQLSMVIVATLFKILIAISYLYYSVATNSFFILPMG